jgi:hypothetical protein
MHCKEQHRYQRPHAPPPPARKAATPRAKPRRKAATRKPVEVGPPQEWQDKVMARVPEHARPYSLQETFVVDDIVDHKTFGLGVVTVVAPDRKIEVAFRDGRKKLAHSR